MKKVKEGLKQYMIREKVQNDYFLQMEYEMIHQNSLKIFLPMQLRKKDGDCSILYDVTGTQTLEQAAGQRKLGDLDCRNLLEGLNELLHTLEDYMLEIGHVDLRKDRICMTKEAGFRFYYIPDEEFSVEKDAEELFAWLLSRMDYRDQRGVKLVYQTYDLLREQGFSLETIEDALAYEDKDYRREVVKLPIEEREEVIPRDESRPAQKKADSTEGLREKKKQKEKKPEKKSGKKKKAKKLQILRIWPLLFSLGLLISICSVGYWGISLARYGFSMHLIQFFLGGCCLSVFFGVTLWGNHKQQSILHAM